MINNILNPKNISFSQNRLKYDEELLNTESNSSNLFKTNEEQKNNKTNEVKTYTSFAKKLSHGFVRLKSWFSQKLFSEKSITHQNLEKAINTAVNVDTEKIKTANKQSLEAVKQDIGNIKSDKKLSEILNKDAHLNKKLQQVEFKIFAHLIDKDVTTLIQKNPNYANNSEKLNEPHLRFSLIPKAIAQNNDCLKFIATFDTKDKGNTDKISIDDASILLYNAIITFKEDINNERKIFLSTKIQSLKNEIKECKLNIQGFMRLAKDASNLVLSNYVNSIKQQQETLENHNKKLFNLQQELINRLN